MRSFLAVTAHWIEAFDETSTGSKKIRLRADLIGFHHIPGRHTGEHLAHCFLHILDRINITSKVSNFSLMINIQCGTIQ
jgi:hypothetical protein